MNSGNETFATITSAGAGITLAQNNHLHGFTLSTPSGTAITGATFGTLTVADVAVNTGNVALSLTTGTLAGGLPKSTSPLGTLAEVERLRLAVTLS
jgi:hypothetical protein